MSTQWLAIQNFQKNQDLLTAINTLSIHTKMNLAGTADKEKTEAIKQARETLTIFFKVFQKVVEQAERGEAKPLVGIDSRLRHLAKSFIAAKNDRYRFCSALFAKSISHIANLLTSADKKDQQELIRCLAELRILAEEQVHADAIKILGEI